MSVETMHCLLFRVLRATLMAPTTCLMPSCTGFTGLRAKGYGSWLQVERAWGFLAMVGWRRVRNWIPHLALPLTRTAICTSPIAATAVSE